MTPTTHKQIAIQKLKTAIQAKTTSSNRNKQTKFVKRMKETKQRASAA